MIKNNEPTAPEELAKLEEAYRLAVRHWYWIPPSREEECEKARLHMEAAKKAWQDAKKANHE